MKTYTNAETVRAIENWPCGGSKRTTAFFYIETDPKRGQRVCRRTIVPKSGGLPEQLGKPVKGTYSPKVRIMTGSDGRTYLVSHGNGSFYIMQGNMKFFEESIYPDDPRYAAMLEAFNAEESPEATLTTEPL